MRKLRGKGLCILLFTYVCMFLIGGQEVFADRKIHVGDIINIKISGDVYTESELRDKFKEFEVMGVKKEDEGYVISVRTFDVGNKSVNLDGQEIQIEVYSTLEGDDLVVIHEGDSARDFEFEIIFSYCFYAVLLIFIILVGINIFMYFRKISRVKLSIVDKFQNDMRLIKFEDIEAPNQITALFKRYLEEKFDFTIMGKTSSEIIAEISRVRGLDPYLERIAKWLNDCDKIKYCRDIATSDEVLELFSEIYKLVQTIDYDKGVLEQ